MFRMTLRIDLPPETEAKLRQRAAASGKDVTAFVRETIEEKLADDQDNGSAPGGLRQGSDEWFVRLSDWVASHPRRPFLADDSRDAIYSEERD